ncbi:hypothetical protein E4656_17395 [Natronospirillum operosum]|uniref:Outer membrane protein beta-barrel domain-containing protein n=1 Tax=Natronospirillum operosum TaxID=2759953 RepID=A0A4Z0W9Q8_9GAMM|nr:transporter [Natronospirillum operosum]TGG91162.1 hypothetical protein E4656_17395 [Natronospirillum operosum]
MMKRTFTALAATLVVSSSLSAQDIGFAPQVGQWELRTDLTDLTFRREKWSNDGDDYADRTRFSINGQALYSISPRLSAGAYVRYFRETTGDGQGESNGGQSNYIIRPIVRYFFTDNLGAGFSYRYYSGRSFDGDGDDTSSLTTTAIVPRVMYRTPLSDEWLLEAYGEYVWFSREDFDGDGETTGEDAERAWVLGTELKYFLSPSFSANLDLSYTSADTDLEDDDTDMGYSAFRADLGFSFYF